MINEQKNKEINRMLKELYEENASAFISLWKDCYHSKIELTNINTFGIIDPQRYDAENGILVIGRESNGESWFNINFEDESNLFVNWLTGICKGQVKLPSRPNMWYNIGRWLMLIENTDQNLSEIASTKSEAIKMLGTMAFTNINKIGGGNQSRKEYWNLYKKDLVVDLVVDEIEIIKPKYIILCDRYFEKALCSRCKSYPILRDYFDNNRLIVMPHPAARTSKLKTLELLSAKLKKVKC